MSEESVQGYRSPGDVELLELKFVTQFGSPIDVTALVDQFSIYQNIFHHYLEAEFIFYDPSKFLHELPSYKDLKITGGFSGMEMMIVSYRNRSKGDKEKVYKHAFRLYSVKDRASANNSEVYMISGVSLEAYETFTNTISSTFGSGAGTTTESMVKSVFKKYMQSKQIEDLYGGLRKGLKVDIKKELETHETAGIHKFIIPELTVDDTIDFFARESDCKSRVPLFYFYEDSENFHFKNVNFLVQEEPIEDFYYSIANVATENENDIIHDSVSIIKYNVLRQHDLLENVDAGLYKAQTTSLDMLKKTYRTSSFDYTANSGKFNRLQERLIPGAVNNDGRIKSLITTRRGHASDTLFSSENPLPKRVDSIKDIRASYRRSIFNTAVEVEIPGNPAMKVGKTVNLNFPVDSMLREGMEERDKYLSGKYLITKVRQIFSSGEVRTVLECTKDGGIA